MRELQRRISRNLNEIADHAPSSAVAWESIQTRIAHELNEPNMEARMLERNPDTGNNYDLRRLAVFVAAAVTLVVIGLFLALPSDDGAVDTDSADVVTTLPAQDPVQDEAQALATAERFVSGLLGLDSETALEVLVDEPTVVSVETASDRDSLARLLELHEIVGRETTLEGCAFREPNQVSCEIRWVDAHFAAGDFAPVESTYLLAIDGDEVEAVRWTFNPETIDPPFTQFRGWLRDNHPGDGQEMFVEENGITEGMSLTDRSFELFELRIPEYLEAFGIEEQAN